MCRHGRAVFCNVYGKHLMNLKSEILSDLDGTALG